MKRALLATAVVMMCVVLSGCTLYFGGWATAGGHVVERAENGEGYIPVEGATVTLKSVSNPEYGLNCLTSTDGHWATDPAKLKCDMYHVTVSKGGYADTSRDFPLHRRGMYHEMEPIIMEKLNEPAAKAHTGLN